MKCVETARGMVARFLALMLLVAFAPIIVAAAILVRLTSKGPAFFIQIRVGLHGHTFPMFKLRTMYHRLASAHTDASRITPLGKFLRRFSIDELPQLWNVVRGDMSLVGPRPHPPQLDARFAKKVPSLAHRYTVRPGITGLAQIMGERGTIRIADDMRRRVALDLEYIDNAGVFLDMRILFRTAVGGFIAPESEITQPASSGRRNGRGPSFSPARTKL